MLRTNGAVAQMGERRVRNAKVGSSILLGSTNLIKPLKHIAESEHAKCVGRFARTSLSDDPQSWIVSQPHILLDGFQ